MKTFYFLGMRADHGIHWYSLLIAFFPLSLKLIVDYYYEIKRGTEPNHKKEWGLFFAVSGVCGSLIYVLEPVHWWQPLVIIAGINVVFFDYALNLLRHLPLTYIDLAADGKTSAWDKLQLTVGGWLPSLFIKFVVAVFCFALYFFSSHISHYTW